jgi:hypothetical protein
MCLAMTDCIWAFELFNDKIKHRSASLRIAAAEFNKFKRVSWGCGNLTFQDLLAE